MRTQESGLSMQEEKHVPQGGVKFSNEVGESH